MLISNFDIAILRHASLDKATYIVRGIKFCNWSTATRTMEKISCGTDSPIETVRRPFIPLQKHQRIHKRNFILLYFCLTISSSFLRIIWSTQKIFFWPGEIQHVFMLLTLHILIFLKRVIPVRSGHPKSLLRHHRQIEQSVLQCRAMSPNWAMSPIWAVIPDCMD